MRLVARPSRTFYYATFEGKSPFIKETDSNAISGEWETRYSNPVQVSGNISPPSGIAAIRNFGKELDFDNVIALDDPGAAIDELSILWVDITPVIDDDGSTSTSHDYIVKRVSRIGNSVVIAISKVNVS